MSQAPVERRACSNCESSRGKSVKYKTASDLYYRPIVVASGRSYSGMVFPSPIPSALDVMSTAASLENGQPPLRTALVVDADPQVEAIISAALDSRRWNVQHASDNIAALAVALSNPCELVITSEKTSGKEDVALLRKLRGVHPHTKLIILTDEATPSDVLASMREHAFSYFSKPLAYDSLAYRFSWLQKGLVGTMALRSYLRRRLGYASRHDATWALLKG